MQMSFSLAWAAIVVLQGIAILLWAMPCGILAAEGEKEGLRFWRTLLISFFLTPLAGVVVILMARSARTGQTVSETTGRNPAATSPHVSS